MKLIFRLAIFSALSTFYYPVYANQVTDKLELLLPQAKDTVRAKLLSDLCWEYRNINTDKALYYGEEAIALCRKGGYNKFLAQALNDVGIIYTDKASYQKALQLYHESLRIRAVLNDTNGIASLYLKIGIVYQKEGKLSEALSNQINALKIYEQLKSDKGIAYCLNNIALIHYNMGGTEKALDYNLQSLKIKEKIGDKYGVAGSLVNIGNIYFDLEKYNESIAYLKRALTILRTNSDKEYLSACLNNLGSSLSKIGKHAEALPLIKEAMEIRIAAGDKKAMLSSYINYANVCFSLKKLEESKQAFEKAILLSEDANLLQEQIGLYESLANVYEQMGNYKWALYYHKLYSEASNTHLNENLNKNVSEMQTKYETEKKEKENKQLKSDNRIKDLVVSQQKNKQKILIVFFIFIIVAAMLGFNLYRAKQGQKQNLLLVAQEKLRLNAIIQTQEKERKRIAAELHDGVGQMMSAVKMNVSLFEDLIDKANAPLFNKTIKMIDNSCTEIRQLSHSMMPSMLIKGGVVPAIREQIDFINQSNKITCILTTFNMDNRLPEMVEVNAYRIVQELLNNSIKHANCSKIDIQLSNEDHILSIMFEDNGNGFDVKMIKSSTGNGWSNIYSRLNAIKGTIEIDSKPQKGTVFFIEIPV